MKRLLPALALLAFVTAPFSGTHGATVELSLDVDILSGQFTVFAEIVNPEKVVESAASDILGISGFQIRILGFNDTTITAVGFDVPFTPGEEGFLVSTIEPIARGFEIMSTQLAPGGSDFKDTVLEDVGLPGQLRIASGTFTGTSGQMGVFSGSLFGFELLWGDTAVGWTGDVDSDPGFPDTNNIEPAEAVIPFIIPEPASLLVWGGLIAFMSLGTCMQSRNKSRA